MLDAEKARARGMSEESIHMFDRLEQRKDNERRRVSCSKHDFTRISAENDKYEAIFICKNCGCTVPYEFMSGYEQGLAHGISTVTIANLIRAHMEHDNEKFMNFAEFIADTYSQANDKLSERIIRASIDGTYKDSGTCVLDERISNPELFR